MNRKHLILLLLTSLWLGIGTATADENPFRFLSIPVRGTIGVDVTASGMQQAIALALHENYDGITFEFDALVGHLDQGVAIAALLKQASEKTRTIALLTRAGGPALPILSACEEWFILEETKQGGPTRSVVEALPPFSENAEETTAHLAALANACKKMIAPGSKAAARHKLFLALTSTGTDLPIPTNEPFPNFSGAALVDLKVATLLGSGLQELGKALGVEAIEAQGDSGIVLVGEAAKEQYKERQHLGTIIDNAFAAIDGIDSLSSAMPWTLERARLADPMAKGRRWRYPMMFGENGWAILPEAEIELMRATDNAIRRWSGVITISYELHKLIDRAEDMFAKIKASKANPIDREKQMAAVDLLASILPIRRENINRLAPQVEEAQRTLATLEALREGMED